MDREIVGKVFHDLRLERGMTQEVLSGLAGVDRSHYSKIENGLSGPSLETVFKLAYALNKTPHEIVIAIEKALDS